MAQMVELAALLLLMMTAHYAVAGGSRMFRDVVWGLVVWCLIFMAAFLLIRVPPFLAEILRVALVVGAAYVGWRLVSRLCRWVFRARRAPKGPRRDEIATLLHWRTACEAEEAYAHVNELQEKHGPFRAALAVARVKQDAVPEQAFAQTREYGEKLAENVQGLAARLRKLADDPDAEPFLEGLLWEYRLDDVRSAMKRLEGQPEAGGRLRSRLLKALRQCEPATPFLAALEQAEQERTPSLADLDRFFGSAGLGLAVLFPPLAFFQAGQTRRGGWFLAAYLILVVYAIAALRQGNSAGWVFLAVAGLYHLCGVFALRDLYVEATCERERSARRAQGSSKREG